MNMELEEIIKKFRWKILSKIYGCAHNSIVGFITYEWLTINEKNSVFDGAPSPNTGSGRKGQKNADLILCTEQHPLIVVEVETQVKKYFDKLKSILDYLKNKEKFAGLKHGLMVLTNLCSGERNYKHNWDDIKEEIKNSIKKPSIALISIEKIKTELKASAVDELRKVNDYYPWTIANIQYCIFCNQGIKEGILWDMSSEQKNK